MFEQNKKQKNRNPTNTKEEGEEGKWKSEQQRIVHGMVHPAYLPYIIPMCGTSFGSTIP